MLGELTRWNPFEELSNWHRDIDEMFGRLAGHPELSLGSQMPPMETYRKDGQHVVRIDLPGVDPKNVDVHTEGNRLIVTGERKSEEEGPEYRETFYGKFERQVTLPQGVEADKISARYENGVFEIRVPLPAELVGRKIPIQVGETKKIRSKAA